MSPYDKPKSRLQTHAPQCTRCRAPMKVRTLYPGRRMDDVTYRCDECGAEVMRSVPRPQ
jgi:predicted SprT family Zn-dependent metalloprotease